MTQLTVAEQAANIRKMSDKDLVEIYDEYEILQCARAAGVDNWDWWMSWVEDEEEDDN